MAPNANSEVAEVMVDDEDLSAVAEPALAGRSVGINCTVAFFCMITKKPMC